jgi:hypothetical protein
MMSDRVYHVCGAIRTRQSRFSSQSHHIIDTVVWNIQGEAPLHIKVRTFSDQSIQGQLIIMSGKPAGFNRARKDLTKIGRVQMINETPTGFQRKKSASIT